MTRATFVIRRAKVKCPLFRTPKFLRKSTPPFSIRPSTTFGYIPFTAEQLLSKIEEDPSCLAILGHLTEDMQPTEKRRLLLEVLPHECLFSLQHGSSLPDKDMHSLKQCFRFVFDEVPGSVKQEVIMKYINLLRQGTGETIRAYELVFFQATDLRYAPAESVALVKEHLFALLEDSLTKEVLRMLRGIGAFLSPDDFPSFIDPLCGPVNGPDHNLKDIVTLVLSAECGPESEMTPEVRKALTNWLSDMVVSEWGGDGYQKVKEIIESPDCASWDLGI